MEDPILNRSLEESKELHARWSQFRDFVMMAVRQRKVTAQAEMKFLELKCRIAMLHDGFMERLEHEQKTGQNIMSILADCILLNRCAQYSDAERQKFEFDWNECFLLITEQISTLESEKERLAGINERAFKAARRKEVIVATIQNFFRSGLFKGILITFAIVMVVWGIPALGIYDYRNFYKMSWSRPLYVLYTNEFYRPFINGDYDYNDLKEVPARERKHLQEGIGALRQERQFAAYQELFPGDRTGGIGGWAVPASGR